MRGSHLYQAILEALPQATSINRPELQGEYYCCWITHLYAARVFCREVERDLLTLYANRPVLLHLHHNLRVLLAQPSVEGRHTHASRLPRFSWGPKRLPALLCLLKHEQRHTNNDRESCALEFAVACGALCTVLPTMFRFVST